VSTTSRVPLQLPLLPASDLCQRWREQRVVWRHRHAAGETFIPRGYEVAPIGTPQTAEFLRDHHYLHKLPATRFRLGLLHGVDLVGIAVLGPGMPHTLRALFPALEPAAESLASSARTSDMTPTEKRSHQMLETTPIITHFASDAV